MYIFLIFFLVIYNYWFWFIGMNYLVKWYIGKWMVRIKILNFDNIVKLLIIKVSNGICWLLNLFFFLYKIMILIYSK